MVPEVAPVLGLGTWAHFAPRSLGAMVLQEVALNQAGFPSSPEARVRGV